ncbi:MAG TPA: hydroxymethylbilane synthase [Acetobacteraceae bacterium]|nr:hydroxymethylbilane synthase [Acetobacteraceae bacterium]
MKSLVLATRRSPLALAQAALAASHLRARLGVLVELRPIVTTGDRQAEWSLIEKGGKGLFTSELEEVLAGGEADLAVHSAKDLPGDQPKGLLVAGYLPRADPRDVLVRRADVRAPRKFATASLRRRSQAALRWPGAEFCEIRGNIDTRLKKIAEQGLADATFLAAAGLQRLGIERWPGLEFEFLDPERMVPAVGQGAIAIECREAEAGKFSDAFDAPTARSVSIERALQAALGAGCHTAFAAHVAGEVLHIFHERAGIRRIPLTAADFDDPAAAAARILVAIGLGPGPNA